MSKHTPKPWTFERNGKSDTGRNKTGTPYAWVNLDCPGHLGGMRCTFDASKTDIEVEANARLIAVAPELLELLKKANAWVFTDAESYPEAGNLYDKIQAAITKAEEG